MFKQIRQEGTESQMTFHFQHQKNYYYPKVEKDGKNSFKVNKVKNRCHLSQFSPSNANEAKDVARFCVLFVHSWG